MAREREGKVLLEDILSDHSHFQLKLSHLNFEVATMEKVTLKRGERSVDILVSQVSVQHLRTLFNVSSYCYSLLFLKSECVTLS